MSLIKDMEEVNSRSSSRSNRSSSPFVVKEEEEEEVEEVISESGRITRSQSVESNGSDSRKRRKKNANTNKNVENSSQDIERETRTSTQKNSKEAREAKKAKRDMIIKERLDELEKLEKTVKDGSNKEYHKLLQDIETKRTKLEQVAEMQRSFAEGNVTKFFNAQKYAANSQYHWDKLALRRSMIQYVQHKINLLEQEYYSNHVQSLLDEERLTDWVPPDRPNMISSLTLGLSEEDAENDIEWAKRDPKTIIESPLPAKNSPPINMLASLVDQRKDENDFTLPPLNAWRYDQRPSLPT